MALIDYSEPCFWLLAVTGGIGVVYSGIESWWYFTFGSIVAVLCAFIAGWRVRVLGLAQNLEESVNNLEHNNQQLARENTKLQNEVSTLQTEINKFSKMVGLLGNNVTGIDNVKQELFLLVDKYEMANKRFESNNLMDLFFLVDKDKNSFLSPGELTQMKEYVKAFYGTDIWIPDSANITLNDFVILMKQNQTTTSLV